MRFMHPALRHLRLPATVFVCIVGAATLGGGSSRARVRADCTTTVAAGTTDFQVVPRWCPSGWNKYWNALYLSDESEWEDLTWSGTNQCHPDNLVVRMTNSAVILDMITEARNTTSLKLAKFDWLWNHVEPNSSGGYDTTCEDRMASNSGSGAISIHLQFWQQSVAYRGAILVHEVVHDWSSHVDPDDCNGQKSCDDEFGKSNANTWTVVFYDHAIASYRLRPSSTELLAVNFGNDMCGFMPLLSKLERAEVFWKSRSKLENAFVEKPPVSTWPITVDMRDPDADWNYGDINYEVDHFLGARWGCTKICNLADYTFPNGKKACNEEYQPGNVPVNQWNRQRCNAANNAVAAGVTPAERQQAAQTFTNTKKPCVPGYSEAYLDQYCSGLTNTSTTVPQLDSKWQLDDEPGFDSEEALADCERSFCDAKFNTSWKATARAACYEWDDPIGCVDAVCGDLTKLAQTYGNTSQEYFDAVNCRRNYVEHNGSEHAYYTDPESVGYCERQYVTCVNSKHHDAWLKAKQIGTCNLVPASAQWDGNYQLKALSSMSGASDYDSYNKDNPHVDISECVMQLKLCEAIQNAAKKLSATLVAEGYVVAPQVKEKLDKPDPPPFERFVSEGHRQVRDLAEIASGRMKSDISETQALKMLATPQASFILSDLLGTDTYFAAMGAKGREPVFGAAAVRDAASASLCMTCAKTPAQQAVMRQLATGKTVRERAESAATKAMLQRAASVLSQQERFAYMKRLAVATTGAQVNEVLNAMEAQVKARGGDR